MQQHFDNLTALFKSHFGKAPSCIESIPKSGGYRVYVRMFSDNDTVIGTYGNNLKENETFFYFTEHFKNKNIPVPEVIAVSDDGHYYLQKDLGKISLLDKIKTNNYSEDNFLLYTQVVEALAKLQIKGDENLDYNKCIVTSAFDKQSILLDLFYFKYYFLDTLKFNYQPKKLLKEFDTLAENLSQSKYNYFMYRDFQSRNIIIDEKNNIHFIDFQGGMKGPILYDLASLLWQAVTDLPNDWKEKLLENYITATEKEINNKIDTKNFKEEYNQLVLIRLLQVLGAYGFRGLFEGKEHFVNSIPNAIKNLKNYLSNHTTTQHLPELENCLQFCVSDEVIKKFTKPTINAKSPLTVSINSFSFRETIPKDTSGNGGGYVFDCRCVINPGRIESMKTQTGRDTDVKIFLEQESNMPEFLSNVFRIVDLAVEEYLKKDYSNLMVNFGCTGGQHRSVYAADALTKHLQEKYNIKIILHHIVQEKKNWKN